MMELVFGLCGGRCLREWRGGRGAALGPRARSVSGYAGSRFRVPATAGCRQPSV